MNRVLLALLLAVPGLARAGEQTDEALRSAEGVPLRFIGKWAYVPVTLVPGPMVPTTFASTTGLGQWRLNIALDSPRSFGLSNHDLEYSAVLQRFDAQLAIMGALALRGHAQGEAIVPNNLSSAFGIPASGITGGGGGVVLALISSRRLMLSLTADYAALQQALISPALSLSQAVTSFNVRSLRSTQDNQSLTAGASFAVSFTDWAGFVAEAAWDGNWLHTTGILVDPNHTEDFLNLAGALSLNTWRQAIPIGATVFYREQIPLGGSPFLGVRQYGGGLFYTGRAYLDLGVEVLTLMQQRKSGAILRTVGRTYLAPRIQVYF